MSDLHTLPLRPRDFPMKRLPIRAHVFSTSPHHWYWSYIPPEPVTADALMHGPFESQHDAYASAWRMVEAL